MSKKAIVGMIMLQAALAGCQSYEPTELPSMLDNPVPPGPGLLTGDKGYFEVEVGRSGVTVAK